MKYGFVVEGLNDEDKVLNVVPAAMCVVTRGTRVDNRVKMDVRQMMENCDKVFLVSDPDEAGEQLARMLMKFFPQMVRVQLERDKCLCYRNRKLKVGLEHCSDEYLKTVLLPYVQLSQMV